MLIFSFTTAEVVLMGCTTYLSGGESNDDDTYRSSCRKNLYDAIWRGTSTYVIGANLAEKYIMLFAVPFRGSDKKIRPTFAHVGDWLFVTDPEQQSLLCLSIDDFTEEQSIILFYTPAAISYLEG